jgi:hypothetical protein
MSTGFLGAIAHLQNHIMKSGGEYREWYVGIASDANLRLSQHKAGEDCLPGLCETDSLEDAQAAEQHLMKRGCKGFVGGAVEEAKWVYVYRMGDGTQP